MNPLAFLAALRARFGLFVAALAVTVAAAMGVSLLLPTTYRATASLVVDTGDVQTLSGPINVLFRPQESLAYIQTQVDIITSPKVALKVVTDTALAEEEATRASFEEQEGGEGSIEGWLAGNLLHDLEVETSQSNVIDVSYVADDPEFAARIANAFARAYVDTMLELRVEPTRNAATWFDQQLRTLHADLEQAQARLTEYQRRHGMVSTDERFDVDHARLADMTDQLVRLQDEKSGLRSREQRARQILATGSTLYAPDDLESSGQVQKLRAELRDGEAELRVLATQYGERHPTYQRQLAENRIRRQELQKELREIATGAENLRRQSQLRERELETELARQRTQLLEGKESRDEFAVLTRNVETAQQVYDTVMQRFVVSQVESRASRTNVALLSSAAMPRRPHRPDLALNLALAVAIGTLIGLALVAIKEMTDRRVRSAFDLDALLDHARGTQVPLLGRLGAAGPDARLPRAGGADRALPAPG
ncbi:MAG: GNVR domain-containing protein [Steroidobacteraceae bacterium]